MRGWIALALVMVAFAGCTDEPSEARLIIEFSGQNMGLHDLDVDILFDSSDRPSHVAYNGTGYTPMDNYTVHDLLLDWNEGYAMELSFYDGLGFAVDGMFAVQSNFENACWYWALSINDELSQTGISGTEVHAGDIVKFTYTNCWAEPAEAVLQFDFDGHGPGFIGTTLAYDAATRPAAAYYNASTIEHPDSFTVHDLMATWAGYSGLNVTHFDGLGHALSGVLGVEGTFTNETCRFWKLEINGVDAQTGMSTTDVADGDVVAWRYTDCYAGEA